MPAAMATLRLKSGAETGREYLLSPGLNRIGRSPANEIPIDEASVSSAHCELWLMKERLLVRDLASTNGTFVNGRSVAEAELAEGDLLALGNVEFVAHDLPGRVAIPATPEPPPPPRFAPDGLPCCINHILVHAEYRCPECGEQFCEDCVRILGRRGGTQHAYCPLCNTECVRIPVPRGPTPVPSAAGPPPGWLAKLTKTLRLRR